MLKLITVSDDRFGRKDGKYLETQKKIYSYFEKNKFGIDSQKMYTMDDIVNTEFYNKNKKMLDNPDPSINGRVYKPYSIKHALDSINYGDFLIYTDCSPEMWGFIDKQPISNKTYDIEVLKSLCVKNNGILTAHVKWNFQTHVQKGEVGYHTHENFTTEACMNFMNMTKYKYSLQHASGLVVLQKNDLSVNFAEKWLYYNSIPECASIMTETNPSLWLNEVLNFHKIGHRHDQSISGLLVNDMNSKIIETLDYFERPAYFNPYVFFNFCLKNHKYNFFESNQPINNLKHKIVSKSGDPKAENYQSDWILIVEERKA